LVKGAAKCIIKHVTVVLLCVSTLLCPFFRNSVISLSLIYLTMVFLNVKNKTIDNLLLFLNTGKPKRLSMCIPK